ncbi:MAG: hypothetical protein EOP04_00320 [Proteobacteria bacterium]|nr:MAG: hypothetical protein EOP04_00320 [Pseudomonadota bacterium]
MVHKKADIAIFLWSGLPYFIYLPDEPGLTFSHLSPYLVVWFVSLITLCLTRINYGSHQIFARILLAGSAVAYFLIKFKEVSSYIPSWGYLIPVNIYMAGYVVYSLAYTRHQQNLIMQTLKHTDLENAKNREDFRKSHEELTQFVEKYSLDKPFQVLNLLAKQIDQISLNIIRQSLKLTEPDFTTIANLGITGSKEESLRICLEDDEVEFYLVGISLTGFEFVICGIADDSESGMKMAGNLYVRQLALIASALHKGGFEMIDITQLREPSKGREFHIAYGDDFFKDIRLTIRRKRLSQSKEVQAKLIEGMH